LVKGKTCKSNVPDFLIQKLMDWINVISQKLYDTLRFAGQQQLIGCLLQALNGLAAVSAVLIDSKNIKVKEDSAGREGGLLKLWTKVIDLLTVHSTFSRCLLISKKKSLSELAYQLINTLMLKDLILLPSRITLLRRVLVLPGVKDPRGVDSPIFLLLLATMLKKTDLVSTESVCAMLLQSIGSLGVVTDVRAIDYNKEVSLPVIESLHTVLININRRAIESPNPNSNLNPNKNGGYKGSNNNNNENNSNASFKISSDDINPLRGVIYISLWLDNQLESPPSARMSVQAAGDISDGICQILNATLYGGYSKDFQDFEGQLLPMVTTVSASENEKRTLLSPLGDIHWHAHPLPSDGDYTSSMDFSFPQNDKRITIMADIERRPLRDLKNIVTVLGLMKNRVLSKIEGERVKDDSYDYVSTWQLVALILGRCYTEILGSLLGLKLWSGVELGVMAGVGSGSRLDLNNLIVSVVRDWFEIVEGILAVLTVRLHTIRWAQSSEYLSSLVHITENITQIQEKIEEKIQEKNQEKNPEKNQEKKQANLKIEDDCSVRELRGKMCGHLLTLAVITRDAGKNMMIIYFIN
jgi:hypothetical protein